MNAASILKSTLVSLVLASLVMFSGCGKSVSGKYQGPLGNIDFTSSDAATVTIMGSPVPATYKIDGDKITVHPTSGMTPDLTFTIASDGSLTGAEGSKYTKQ